jgi:hypothetical protein
LQPREDQPNAFATGRNPANAAVATSGEFRAGGAGFGNPDPDWPDGPLDGRKATLQGVVEDTGAKRLRSLRLRRRLGTYVAD